VGANVSEKHVVSIFRAEVTRPGSIGLKEDLRVRERKTPQILYKSSTSQPCHFSLEDVNSIFLRNVGIDLRNHEAPAPKTTPALF
jgi:hypothetical protein